MESQSQSQFEKDIYFQGSSEQLDAFLYPLGGISSNVMEHLQLKEINLNPNQHKLNFMYDPKQFQNIGKQSSPICYSSTKIPCFSNYFYSTNQSKGLVWRNLKHFMELRPEKLQPNIDNKVLNITKSGDISNKVQQNIKKAVSQDLQSNWNISKQEYLIHLSK